MSVFYPDTAKQSLVSSSSDVPLCVDLDDTLVRTDTLHETLLLLGKRRPLLIFKCILWSLGGRARLKDAVSSRQKVDASRLPYDENILALLRSARGRGRRLILATAAHHSIAEDVARYLGVFDHVFATDSAINLKGHRKASVLVEHFGERGFDYIGDSKSDLPIFRAAREAYFANGTKRTEEWLRARVALANIGSARTHSWQTVVSALRPRLWVTNLLGFVPVSLTTPHGTSLTQIIAAYFSFCFCSSATSLIAELLRLESDRSTPPGWARPIASGALRISDCVLLFGLLFSASILTALILPSGFLAFLAIYAVIALAYTWSLHR